MYLMIDGHPYHYEMENLCRIFFPYEKIVKGYGPFAELNPQADPVSVYTGVKKEKESLKLTVWFQKDGCRRREDTQRVSAAVLEQGKECERLLAVMLFDIFVEEFGYRPQWGILTGIRPIKLLRSLAEGWGEEKAVEFFRTAYLVSEKKTELARRTMHHEQRILSLSRPDSYSLYVSIPFCPTRCAYCSFVSQSVTKAARLIPDYVELLCVELEHTAKVARELGLRLESVYIGGGTPTTLTPQQMGKLLNTIRKNFDLATSREFTVEAGRPDTITPELLRVIQDGGVTRISINPQTLNDAVLQAIGRRHTAAQALEAFSLSREMKFGNINMDLIAGLPQDTEESFQNTLEQVLSLGPESVTVHTLALKRSSRLNLSKDGVFDPDAAVAARMLDYAENRLTQTGYLPYYLYRQSRMVGNLENTGWSKPGFESYYNVYIMDETHTILACGAGAVSKIRDPYSERLERIFNFKFPYEYVGRHEEMLRRKGQVKELYEQFCK